jgi:hypothetical protein
MNKYIFISDEGYTFQPDSTSIEPDIENIQVIGFGQGRTARTALDDLLEHNKYLCKTSFDELIAIQLKNDAREHFSLRDLFAPSY